jgi:ribonuclease BN (tRNA processing enzyme)
VRSETIGTIFLTHLHPDHDLGLADVMGNDFFELGQSSARRTISIYGPPLTRALVSAAFRYISIPFSVFAAESSSSGIGPILVNPFVAHEIQHGGLIYQDDKIRVIAAENSHYALMPAGFRKRMKSYSYRIETPYGVIVFTGDTGPSNAVVRLARGADVLVSNVLDLTAMGASVNRAAKRNHWSPQRTNAFMNHLRVELLDLQEVGEIASSAHVGSVVLNHFDPTVKDPAAYVAGVKRFFSGPVFAGADLAAYCLRSRAGRDISGAADFGPCK